MDCLVCPFALLLPGAVIVLVRSTGEEALGGLPSGNAIPTCFNTLLTSLALSLQPAQVLQIVFIFFSFTPHNILYSYSFIIRLEVYSYSASRINMASVRNLRN